MDYHHWKLSPTVLMSLSSWVLLLRSPATSPWVVTDCWTILRAWHTQQEGGVKVGQGFHFGWGKPKPGLNKILATLRWVSLNLDGFSWEFPLYQIQTVGPLLGFGMMDSLLRRWIVHQAPDSQEDCLDRSVGKWWSVFPQAAFCLAVAHYASCLWPYLSVEDIRHI